MKVAAQAEELPTPVTGSVRRRDRSFLGQTTENGCGTRDRTHVNRMANKETRGVHYLRVATTVVPVPKCYYVLLSSGFMELAD